LSGLSKATGVVGTTPAAEKAEKGLDNAAAAQSREHDSEPGDDVGDDSGDDHGTDAGDDHDS
jgi:hypothetical protein